MPLTLIAYTVTVTTASGFGLKCLLNAENINYVM